MKSVLLFALATFAAAACGDDNKGPIDAPLTDTVLATDAAPAHVQAVVVAGDFTAGHPGTMSKLDLTTMVVTKNIAPAGAIGDDPLLRKFGNELFVINRADGDNITILDATTFALVEQLGTGAGTNPQDVAVVGQKLYVPVLSGKGVVVLTRGSITTKVIDLSADDPDGNPDCSSAIAVGADVYVSCGLLDASFSPRGNGKIYVIDTATDTRTKTITLMHKNPFGTLEQAPAASALHGDLVIPTVDFTDGSGCLERISTGASAASGGCVVDNTNLAGYPIRAAFQALPDATVFLWLAVAASDFTHQNLQGFDLLTSMLSAAPISPDTEIIADVVGCPNNTVVVSDHHKTAANGLRVYANRTETTTAPLPIGLDPTSGHGLVCY